MRCSCGYSLVVDYGDRIHFNFGEWRLYKDTGKVEACCRRCPKKHIIEPGKELRATMQASIVCTILAETLDNRDMPVL